MGAFDYPNSKDGRLHGPQGYVDYESYRSWLRDEFLFRCVYCLKRERWGQFTREFDIEHFKPQAASPELATQYDNLVYSCARCNAIKLDKKVPDPFPVLRSNRVRLLRDGRLDTSHRDANRLILQLDLNSPRLVEWRRMWVQIVQLAKKHNSQLYDQLMGFPKDLPNLSRRRPPDGNSRRAGIKQSCFERRERGELPKHY